MPKDPSKPAAKRIEARPTLEAGISLSQNDFERRAQENLDAAALEQIRKCQTPRGKEFIFRCFMLPGFSLHVCHEATKQFRDDPSFIHQPWSYIVAQSRTVREMVFQQEVVFDDADPPVAKLGLGEERYGYWLGRFDCWQSAVERSFRSYLDRKGGVLNFPAWPHAAALGAIHHLWAGLPAPLLGRLVVDMRRRSMKESEIFHRQAACPQGTEWLDPDLDLWLMEIWPLVVGYDWTYSDAWRVAREKFSDAADNTRRSLKNAEAFSNHCKMKGLDLRLSAKARGRGGRPRGASKDAQKKPLPPMAELALEIGGFVSPGVMRTEEEMMVYLLSGLVTGQSGSLKIIRLKQILG